MEVVVSGKDICMYIPQREPIVMIDKFYGIEGNTSTTGLTVKADCILCADGRLTDGGVIEHIAQSGAMYIGYEAISKGERVPLGFIGSINKMTINRLPNAGEELLTTIVMEAKVGDISLVSATVQSAGETIATGKMKVATKPQ